ncbi:glycosyltransferase family 2 protein [Thioalkalicoccus limnaeus]|uniref:Glycosyltransferase family 2 protein n=1 Tax=Thioalkalicoccus limnaeus TaxID=120681 RepID=A0ABV4BHE8_9GAMM
MIIAVVVSFFPDVATLSGNLDVIRDQVNEVILVDNGSPAMALDALEEKCGRAITLCRLGCNTGIAGAQNVGIRIALERGATHVVLFDQDSVPQAGAVRHLHEVALELDSREVPVGLVASSVCDIHHPGGLPFFRLANGVANWIQCPQAGGIIEIDTAIASGSLIPARTLQSVGAMNEALFIDLVDIDWCFRARAHGFRNFCACDARLSHRLGDRPAQALGRVTASHSPLRNYYYFRNAVWLFRQDHVPDVWKRALARQLRNRYLTYPLFARPRWSYLRQMTWGLLHGMRGRLGPR